MRDLEKLCGSTRLSLIYLGSGMVGNLASAIFVPYRAEVGPAGAHFGLLALSMVEVIHQWPTLKYPEMAILKIGNCYWNSCFSNTLKVGHLAFIIMESSMASIICLCPDI